MNLQPKRGHRKTVVIQDKMFFTYRLVMEPRHGKDQRWMYCIFYRRSTDEINPASTLTPRMGKAISGGVAIRLRSGTFPVSCLDGILLSRRYVQIERGYNVRRAFQGLSGACCIVTRFVDSYALWRQQPRIVPA